MTTRPKCFLPTLFLSVRNLALAMPRSAATLPAGASYFNGLTQFSSANSCFRQPDVCSFRIASHRAFDIAEDERLAARFDLDVVAATVANDFDILVGLHANDRRA